MKARFMHVSFFQRVRRKVPLIFHFHGYMGRGWDWADMLAYTVAGYGVVSMDVSGASRAIRKTACALH